MATKKLWTLFLFTVLLCSLPLFAQADQAQSAQQNNECKYRIFLEKNGLRPIGEEALWWQAGGKGFTQNCLNCHSRNNTVGASFIHVESRTSKGWDRVFTSRNVQCAKDGSWASLTPKQLQDINDYLYRYAYGTWGVYESRFG